MIDKFRQESANQMRSYLCLDAGDEQQIRMPGAPSRFQDLSGPRMVRPGKVLFAACVAMLLAWTLSGCASQPKPTQAQAIAIESVRITAAGHNIDLRYRVLDPDKANASLGPGVKPTLIDEATGTVMAVPTTAKLGALRQTKAYQKTDRSYFVLFVNSAGLVPGSKVTAQMGDMTFEGLTVE